MIITIRSWHGFKHLQKKKIIMMILTMIMMMMTINMMMVTMMMMTIAMTLIFFAFVYSALND